MNDIMRVDLTDLERQIVTSTEPTVTPAPDRQMTLDAALADATEVVARQRVRLGRRVCSRADGATIRRIYELLRAMADVTGGADNDPSFQ